MSMANLRRTVVREQIFSKKELFQRQRLPLLLRIPDLDDNVEIDDGLEEGKLLPFILPYLFQTSE